MRPYRRALKYSIKITKSGQGFFLKKIKKRAYSLVFLGTIRLIRFGFITVANIPANIPK